MPNNIPKRYYPRLSELIQLTELPTELSFLKTRLTAIFDKIHYKNFQFSKSRNGDSAFYSLDIVTKERLDIPLLGGVSLVLNPDKDGNTGISSFPISFEYEWQILAYIKSFNLQNFGFTLEEFYQLGLTVFRITDEQATAHIVNFFVLPGSPSVSVYEQVLLDVNAAHGMSLHFAPSDEQSISTLTEIIDSSAIPDTVSTILFKTYILETSDPNATKRNLEQFYKRIQPEGIEVFIRRLVTPRLGASLELSAGIEFPRNLFTPVYNPDGSNPLDSSDSPSVEIMMKRALKPIPIYDTNVDPDQPKALMRFAQSQFRFDTQTGLDHDLDLSLNTTSHFQIGQTGFIVFFSGLKLDVRDNKNIPEADADGRPIDFKGIYAQSADITLPPFWGSTTTLAGTNILIGNPGGFSGDIALSTTNLTASLFGLDITLTELKVSFKQNEVQSGSKIIGTLAFSGESFNIIGEFRNKRAATSTTPATNSGYFFSASPTGASKRIELFKGIILELDHISFTRDNDNDESILDIGCKFIVDKTALPLVGKYFPDSLDMQRLAINSVKGITALEMSLKWEGKKSTATVTASQGELRLDYQLNINEEKDTDKMLFLAMSAVFKFSERSTDFSFGLSANLPVGFGIAKFKDFGIKTTILFVDSGGDIGPLKFEATGIMLPSGIGVSIDTDKVKGGGFLNIDREKGLFSGGLELSFEKFSLTALGLLATKLPSGEKGFSLLILVNSTFTGIPIGFGFTLNGVGGILGINRVANTDELRKNVSTGAIGKILFPEKIVANADELLGKLATFFPIHKKRHLLGFMLRIQYSEFVIADLGLILEIPSPIRAIILGSIKCVLPEKSNPILALRVDFLGTIDFNPLRIYFDASLVDSKIASYSLTGDLALRLITGDKPNFVFSAGGFHPAYVPPPLALDNIRRITIGLNGSSKVTLSAQMYVALTSNSAQFGASISFAAVSGDFSAKGYLGFDALFYFKPFRFQFETSLAIALSYKSKEVLSLSAQLRLSGPNKWATNGIVQGKIIGLKFEISFDEEWGNAAATEPLTDVTVYPLLRDALTDPKNWIPNRQITDEFVSIRSFEGSDKVVLGPSGSFSIRQNAVPLNLTLNKFGTARITDTVKRFYISKLRIGGIQISEYSYTKEFFPLSHFKELTENERLRNPSFEQFDNGIEIPGIADYITNGRCIHKAFEFEQIIIDKVIDHPNTGVVLPPVMTAGFATYTVASESGYGSSTTPVSAAVALTEEKYFIMNTQTLVQLAGPGFGSFAQAQEEIARLVKTDPNLEGKYMVMGEYEF